MLHLNSLYLLAVSSLPQRCLLLAVHVAHNRLGLSRLLVILMLRHLLILRLQLLKALHRNREDLLLLFHQQFVLLVSWLLIFRGCVVEGLHYLVGIHIVLLDWLHWGLAATR
jgi:hypothetical protein